MRDDQPAKGNDLTELYKIAVKAIADKKLLRRVILSALGVFTYFWLYVFGFLTLMPKAFNVFVDNQLYSDLTSRLLITAAASAFFGKFFAFSVRSIIYLTAALPFEKSRKSRLAMVTLKKASTRYETIVAVVLTVLFFIGAQVGPKHFPVFIFQQILAMIGVYVSVSILFFRRLAITPSDMKKVSNHRVVFATVIFAAFSIGSLSNDLGEAQFVLRMTRNLQLIEVEGKQSIAAPVFSSKGGLVLVLELEEEKSFFGDYTSQDVEVIFVPYSEMRRITEWHPEK